MSLYHDGNRELQDRFDTRRLADAMLDKTVRDTVSTRQKAFIESCDMFFLATADAQGRPSCSYKGGDPGFVRVIDDRTLAIPNYDGNGMYLSWGNVIANPNVGMLFIDFMKGWRLRIGGVAGISETDPLLDEYCGAQFIVRVTVREIFGNCPRYIHKYQLIERSAYVPHVNCETPVPDWKKAAEMKPLLSSKDPARARQ
jgi:predicted pyridoxine 5'-phosphate oxidase superfamily flavin-nucleotide-binding protein